MLNLGIRSYPQKASGDLFPLSLRGGACNDEVIPFPCPSDPDLSGEEFQVLFNPIT